MNQDATLYRTGKWEGLKAEWIDRARLASSHLRDVASVVDIGCGRMTIKSMLPANVKYQGLDVSPRDETTIVVDLNEEILPSLAYEAALVLGVVEYLEDPAGFFARLPQFRKVVLSFNCYSLRDVLQRHGLYNRVPSGWRHRLRRAEITGLFEANGFEVEKLQHVCRAEYMWVARRR